MADPQTTQVVYVGDLVSVSVATYGTASVGGDPIAVPDDVAAGLVARGDFMRVPDSAAPKSSGAPKAPAPTPTPGASAEQE